MRAAAYCRVSTDKEDQLNSLETQKAFFEEYIRRTGDTLVRIYADEGISGTKTRNRKEFLHMMQDAEHGLFDMLIVKDISRLARNTVDFLESIRSLNRKGIQTEFLTANMKSMGDSEFILTILAALAQEESNNTSKRVKFGKKFNAEKGRVPNIVYGYDKIIGEYFDLTINQREADVIRKIYQWYIHDGYGGYKIASMLNKQGIKTKRNCQWTQNAVCRILSNEIYIGRIINGKEEITDFLTSKRAKKDASEWMIVERPELRIIEPEQFAKAQEIMQSRHQAFNMTHERQSNKHLFSTLIRCKECGFSFRRYTRKNRKNYVRWICSGRNANGTGSCPNEIRLEEDELISVLEDYFAKLLQSKKHVIAYVINGFQKTYKAKDENEEYERELNAELASVQRKRQKYMDMYTDDLISREELNAQIGGLKERAEQLQKELDMLSTNLTKGNQLEKILQDMFGKIEDITDVRSMTNAQLKQIIQKIEVDKDGNVDIYLRVMGDLGLDESVLVCDNQT